MGLNRREFVHLGGLGLLLAAGAAGRAHAEVARVLGSAGDRAAGVSSGPQQFEAPDSPLLVTIFLRGAADGLHLLPPTGDRGYASLRGSLALKSSLPFSPLFSLHPEFAGLDRIAKRGQLAVVHAAGSPIATRSHFEAQDIMEFGDADGRVSDGWLARALSDVNREAPFAALALSRERPLSLRGSGAFAIDAPLEFGLRGASRTARAALARRYADGTDAVARNGTRALTALSEYERALGTARGSRGERVAARKRRGSDNLLGRAEQLLAIDRAGLGLRAACLESGDWDSHSNQGTEQGKLAGRIRDLGDGVAALAEGLGQQRDWLVVVMTEFGRTVRPNGSGGSDHGHGGAMLVAGPRVRGGVHGDWLGLSEENLYEGRDLPVLTDWRHVLHEVLAAHLGGAPPARTFPGFDPAPLGLIV